MKNNRKLYIAYLGLFLMTSIIGLSFIFVKTGLKYCNPVDLLAHRFSTALFCIVILVFTKIIKLPKITWEKLKILILLSVFFPSMFFLMQAYGMRYSTASEAGIIFAILPIVTLIFAQLFLKEKTSIIQKLGILLSVSGVIYIVLNKSQFSGSFNIQDVGLLLLSMISFATYLVIGKKMVVKFSSIEITVWIITIACIVFNIWGLISHYTEATLSDFLKPFQYKEFIGVILYLGVLSSVLTSFLTNNALPIVPASQMAVFNNLSPIFAVIGGVVLLGEHLELYHIIGGLMIFVGIVMTLKVKN